MIEKRLGKLPRKLSELYDELYCTKFDSHENEETAIAEGVFRWLLCSHVPLETDEFLVAVSFCSGEATELTKDTLLNLCFNFIVHDDSVNVFRFAHLSVREYLESKNNYEASFNHATAAFSCLSYLTLPLKRNQAPLRKFNYAYFGWATHSASSGKRRLEGGLHELFRKFLGSIQCPSPFFVKWSSKIVSKLHGSGSIQLPVSRISTMRSSPISPIFAASAWGFSEILETEVGFEPFILDRQNKSGFTALMISSRYDQQDIVRLLLQNNVDLEIRSRYASGDGGTALQIASRSGHTTVVRMLLDHGANIDTQMFDKSTPLLEASSYGHKDIVQILLEKGADVNGESPRTALAATCAQGNADIVRLLISSGADVNSFDRRYGTALIGAATYGRCIIIQLLCEAGANVNLKLPSLEPGSYLSNKYPSALIAAAARGHIDSVQLLLKSGADVDSWSGTWNYSTALISAAQYGHKEITILLLEYGADVDLHNVDWQYTSALIAAIRNGHTEIVSLVLEARADVNRKSTRFGSALEAAVETDHKAAVPLLLKKGAKMDLNDREKITAVIELGNIELVRAIIDSGVDVHAKDSHGWTPYDVAWAHGYKSICDLLPIEPSLNAYQDQVHGLRPDGLSKMGKMSGAWIPQDDLTVARGCMPFQQESMPI